MEDQKIIALYLARDERALALTAEKYGGYCAAIAGNVLDSAEDVEEVVSDTWLRTWNAIPPERPGNLKLYLARIVRNLSYDRFRTQCRQKRGGGEITVALEELSHSVPGEGQPGDRLEGRELQTAVNRFLGTLKETDRKIFLLRYFLVEPTAVISRELGIRETAVRTSLSRTRKKLKEFLQKEELYYE